MESSQLITYLFYTILLLGGLFWAYKTKLIKKINTTKKPAKATRIISTILGAVFLIISISGLVSLITVLTGSTVTQEPLLTLLTTLLFGAAGIFLLYLALRNYKK